MVLGRLLQSDNHPGQRQLAIINMSGQTAIHQPVDADRSSQYWGAMSGKFYACQGNTLTGRNVIAAMATAYEDTQGSLSDRLMAALIAADCEGGDHRGRLAAGIRVAKLGRGGHWLELQVDESNNAVIDLARKYATLKHPGKGKWRGGQLPFQPPCSPAVGKASSPNSSN